MTFTELQLGAAIMRALSELGYSTPTPVQQEAIPHLLRGRDLLACAQTGTGKTAAFALPILNLMNEDHAGKPQPGYPKALVITPTRELALQIQESFKDYGKYLPQRSVVIFGGVKQHAQTEQLKHPTDVLVATPGRLLDLIDQGFIHLGRLEYFVLDEADRMLDMGFIHDIRKVIKLLPAKRQSLFFSATMPENIAGLAANILTDPVTVEVTPVSSTAETIQQYVYHVSKEDKRNLLLHILENENGMGEALVFTRTKYGADKVARFLSKNGVKSEAIHGDKAQNVRQRALNNFKEGKTRVLVATDIAARGIDIDELRYVINFEVPNIPETYVHRIGRTGRAGSNGTALSFSDSEERLYVRDVEKLTSQSIPLRVDHPFHADFGSLPASGKKGAGKQNGNVSRNRPRHTRGNRSR